MNQDELDQAQQAASNLPLPGQLIRQARQQRGLDLAQLSEKTRLTEHVLDAVERNDFDTMGEPVYARGYYRKCAEALSLNSVALVEAYEQHSGTVSPVPTIDQRPSIAYREGPGKVALGIAVLLIVVVFAACAVWLWNQEQQRIAIAPELSPQPSAQVQPSPLPSSEPTVLAESASETQQATQPGGQTKQFAADTASAQAALKVIAPKSTQAPAATPKPQAQAEISRGTALLRLEISGGDAWVDIRDRDGAKLLYKLLKAGNVREVQGDTPFRVSLGRADHVVLALNGQAIDISNQLEPGLTAKFLMDASGRMFEVDGGTAQ